jgi:hypothetical protein
LVARDRVLISVLGGRLAIVCGYRAIFVGLLSVMLGRLAIIGRARAVPGYFVEEIAHVLLNHPDPAGSHLTIDLHLFEAPAQIRTTKAVTPVHKGLEPRQKCWTLTPCPHSVPEALVTAARRLVPPGRIPVT